MEFLRCLTRKGSNNCKGKRFKITIRQDNIIKRDIHTKNGHLYHLFPQPTHHKTRHNLYFQVRWIQVRITSQLIYYRICRCYLKTSEYRPFGSNYFNFLSSNHQDCIYPSKPLLLTNANLCRGRYDNKLVPSINPSIERHLHSPSTPYLYYAGSCDICDMQ